jgi:predicted transport protein
MPIFKINKGFLSPIKEVSIKLERDLQKMTEENLGVVFGLKFVSTEFSLQKFRIDTLAFDEEANSFVIIEYKRDKNFSVVDQGFAYLSLMLNNKADFILEYNENLGKGLKRGDVDWSQSRVLFIAQSFTTYQQNAINFKDLPIELWEAEKYDNDTILYKQLKSSDKSESINKISKNKTIQKVSKEVKVYTVDDHIGGINKKIADLFYALREKIFSLDDNIEERAKKKYIAYRTGSAFLYLHLQQAQIKLHLIAPVEKLDDPRKISRDVSNIGHYGGGITEVSLSREDDLNYVFGLIEQSYRFV